MSHTEQLEFVQNAKLLFPDMFRRSTVLEVGSLDINGTIRGFFSDCVYTGLDVASGKGVDIICEGQKYDAPDASFDVVISCEVMEHNPFWAATLTNMIRLLKPGGLMLMSCATVGRPEHGTASSDPDASPLTVEKGWNYYRNLTRMDIVREVDFSALSSWGFAKNWEKWDLYFLGIKAGGQLDAAEKIGEFKAIYRRRFLPAWYRRFSRVIRNPLALRRFFKSTSAPFAGLEKIR